MWYQPKIDIRRKCLAGVEVDVRVAVAQSDAPIAVRVVDDVIDKDQELTEQIIGSALSDWNAFAQAGYHLRLAIDVSAAELLAAPIADWIDRYRPPSASWPGLVLEVPEEQIAREMPQIRHVADRLRASGVDIAIDHFGAGYCSFASLRQLPFVEIKLDRSFVQNCAADATNAAICQTAVDLAHRFASAAVAQGIGNAADLRALAAMGCNIGQGPLLVPPMPRKSLLGLLNQRSNRVGSGGG